MNKSNEEKDIEDFASLGNFLEESKKPQYNILVNEHMGRMATRTSLYLEFLAGAFLKETGLKASECELVSWIDGVVWHWEYRKKESGL